MGRGKFGTVYHVVGRKSGISYASKHVKYRWKWKYAVLLQTSVSASTGASACVRSTNTDINLLLSGFQL